MTSNTSKAERSRTGLAALWVGWVLACLSLLGFGCSALSERSWSLLTLRHTQALATSEELAGAFPSLERLPRLLVATARDAADSGTLGASRLGALRQEGQPFCQLYWLRSDGRPVVAGEASPPAWLWQIARLRAAHAIQVLRPMPPGWEVGRLSSEQLRVAEETPERYLAATARTADGDVVLAELDLSYVFGGWLKKRLERGPVGEGMSFSLEGFEGLPQTPPTPPRVGLWPGDRSSEVSWRWAVPTFFASTPQPFSPIVLSLDNAPALRELRYQMARLGALAAVVMAAFALSIALTARAVRRELQYAEARARFTEMVSHELRTPLAAISMYGEILREGLVEDPARIASYHNLLASETERLKRLVEGVLAFGRLRAQSVPVDWQDVSLPEVAEQAVAVVSPLGLQVSLQVPELRVRSDTGVLVQILVNLLENAAKHAGVDKPVELFAEGGDNSIVWEVRDRGPGVPEARRAEIFQPYTRVLPAHGPKTAGVGLGLAVVEGLAGLLGGKVECRAREGGGSVFAVILPRRA